MRLDIDVQIEAQRLFEHECRNLAAQQPPRSGGGAAACDFQPAYWVLSEFLEQATPATHLDGRAVGQLVR